MPRLLVNIDHVATLRNARRETVPDPVEAAAACEAAGADGIVFHLRRDRRHIRDDDVRRLKEAVRGKLDFELSLSQEIVDICRQTRPQLATLVPERREEVTTEGGLDVVSNRARLLEVIPSLYEAGIGEVALFVEPDITQVEAAAAVGANCIELHTGAYANAAVADRSRHLALHAAAAQRAGELGLTVHAGHGFTLENFPAYRAQVLPLSEVSIGFSLMARSMFVGLEEAVREMRAVVCAVEA